MKRPSASEAELELYRGIKHAIAEKVLNVHFDHIEVELNLKDTPETNALDLSSILQLPAVPYFRGDVGH